MFKQTSQGRSLGEEDICVKEVREKDMRLSERTALQGKTEQDPRAGVSLNDTARRP